MTYYGDWESAKQPVEISAQNGRILVSAKSHWGKTYLIKSMLNDFIKNGWNVEILSYTKTSEATYWKELEKIGCHINYADITDYKSLMNFFFNNIKPNSVVYIDDLDLYLNDQADNLKDAINIIKDFFSASRKANIITIYSVKSLKGAPWTTFVEMSEILILGKFNRYSTAWNSFGIPDLEDRLNALDDHEFILKSDDVLTKIKAEKYGIVDVFKYRDFTYEAETEEQERLRKVKEAEEEAKKQIEEYRIQKEREKEEKKRIKRKEIKEKEKEEQKLKAKKIRELKRDAKLKEIEHIKKTRNYLTFFKIQIYMLLIIGSAFTILNMLYAWILIVPLILVFYGADQKETSDLIKRLRDYIKMNASINVETETIEYKDPPLAEYTKEYRTDFGVLSFIMSFIFMGALLVAFPLIFLVLPYVIFPFIVSLIIFKSSMPKLKKVALVFLSIPASLYFGFFAYPLIIGYLMGLRLR